MRLTSGGRLPKGFVLAKPIAQESYDEAVIYELERKGRLLITRKRDGWKMFAVVGSNNKVRLFTDGLNEIDSRFDHIKKELERIKLFPNTILVGEAIVDLEGSDDLGKIISIFHSNTERSIQLQKANGMAMFMIFGRIWPELEGNEPSYLIARRAMLAELFSLHEPLIFVFPVLKLDISFDQAKKMVVEKGWEGLVLYDKDYVLTYRTDGKAPKRPEGCYKWKPILEDDFIVREWITRPDGTVKELVLLQIDSSANHEFECGKLGSFNGTIRKELAEMKYPIVVQVAFEARYPKSGKVRNARFLRVRGDKPVKQCVSPKSYSEAEYK